MVGNIITNIELEPMWSFLPKQVETLQSITKFKFTLYSGAVGAGKTLLLAHAAIDACINNPGCKGMLGSLTYTQLTNVVFTVFNEEILKYEDLLKEKGYDITLITRRVNSTGKMMVEFWNGSIIYFLACDDELKLRGYTLDFFGLDEPIDIDETIFTQLMARLRGKNLKQTGREPFGVLTTNPGAESHWIFQRFLLKNHKDYNAIQTTTYDNVFLPPSYITTMEESYDEDWILRMLNGKWGAYAGQIYKSFNIEKHVGDWKEHKDIQYYIAGMDWGVRNPSCILTIGVTSDKKAIVVDEYYQNNRTSRQVVEKLEILNKHYKYRKVFADPSALDLITQCEQKHLPVEKGDNHVEPGIGKCKSMFDKNMIYIDYRCRNLIRELQSYRYAKDKLNQNPEEKPVKLDDHSCDALRYALFTHRAWSVGGALGYIKRSLWEI
jgi:PBSX family phage terminase large subunit